LYHHAFLRWIIKKERETRQIGHNTLSAFFLPTDGGVHLLVEGKPPTSKKAGNIEVYGEKHYLTISGSEFGATAHNTAHDAFMTLSPYTSTREDVARRLGRGPNPRGGGLLSYEMPSK